MPEKMPSLSDPATPGTGPDDALMHDLLALAHQMVALRDTLIDQLGVVATLVQAAQSMESATTANDGRCEPSSSSTHDHTTGDASHNAARDYHLID